MLHSKHEATREDSGHGLMNGVKKVAVAGMNSPLRLLLLLPMPRMKMILQTGIAGASNDSWTGGDPEMKKENLVSHVAPLGQMAMGQANPVLEVAVVHLSYWTLEHLSRGHGG